MRCSSECHAGDAMQRLVTSRYRDAMRCDAIVALRRYDTMRWRRRSDMGRCDTDSDDGRLLTMFLDIVKVTLLRKQSGDVCETYFVLCFASHGVFGGLVRGSILLWCPGIVCPPGKHVCDDIDMAGFIVGLARLTNPSYWSCGLIVTELLRATEMECEVQM
jgi:hypothetical protein